MLVARTWCIDCMHFSGIFLWSTSSLVPLDSPERSPVLMLLMLEGTLSFSCTNSCFRSGLLVWGKIHFNAPWARRLFFIAFVVTVLVWRWWQRSGHTCWCSCSVGFGPLEVYGYQDTSCGQPLHACSEAGVGPNGTQLQKKCHGRTLLAASCSGKMGKLCMQMLVCKPLGAGCYWQESQSVGFVSDKQHCVSGQDSFYFFIFSFFRKVSQEGFLTPAKHEIPVRSSKSGDTN